MSEIVICRPHGKTRAAARAAAEHMVDELADEYDLHCSWEGDQAHFRRPGVSGQLTIDDQNVEVSIRLGLLLLALKPTIEKGVHKFFAENFPEAS
ncbi:MAG TPA: polyhydroxyalkanoic acid system family protein [Accumulibacter sp.]|nr:polyhydroxyalkanoic acid system family protein [Accumulibacter sp.]HMW17497.1 polyhydroxyalkanoic acid system family protein [Accumulibacter sp.]HMX21814.1 polyhydroxyalkanoic acid system family protein [Accumulibacter sp.]HNC19106.1 polyhydroxyalkanoic acid system family protein [Accumulibacter sp.]HND80045.1 polyhydroxyalkanoic acid system family protein [Accumulibacter sp.]